MEGAQEKILLKSFFQPTLRPISSDIKHGEKSFLFEERCVREREQRQENTRSITWDVDRKIVYIKNGSGREAL